MSGLYIVALQQFSSYYCVERKCFNSMRLIYQGKLMGSTLVQGNKGWNMDHCQLSYDNETRKVVS